MRASRIRRKQSPTAAEVEWLAAYDAPRDAGDIEADEDAALDDGPDEEPPPPPLPPYQPGPPVPVRLDAQLSAALEIARRSSEAGVQWMERACAQFERVAQAATSRSRATEEQLVAALTGLAGAQERERDGAPAPGEDEPRESEGSDVDRIILGGLARAMGMTEEPPADVAPNVTTEG